MASSDKPSQTEGEEGSWAASLPDTRCTFHLSRTHMEHSSTGLDNIARKVTATLTFMLSAMPSYVAHACVDGRGPMLLTASIFLFYFSCMDVQLYITLQGTNLTQVEPRTNSYSMFSPLSIKLILSDPVSNYIMNPLAEIFDQESGFSRALPFITPNMISISHILVALVSAKLVSSDVTSRRRLGVLFFQLRSFLDTLDGVVYRSHAGMERFYHSDRNSWGYIVDTICDVLGGTILLIGALIHFLKRFHRYRLALPSWMKRSSHEKKSNGVMESGFHYSNGLKSAASAVPSVRAIFLWMLLMYVSGLLASYFWDLEIVKYKHVFQTPLKDPHLRDLQASYLHSFSSWIIMWLWRYLCGQNVFQISCFVIFFKKDWEYVRYYNPYVCLSTIVLIIISSIYTNHIQYALGL